MQSKEATGKQDWLPQNAVLSTFHYCCYSIRYLPESYHSKRHICSSCCVCTRTNAQLTRSS